MLPLLFNKMINLCANNEKKTNIIVQPRVGDTVSNYDQSSREFCCVTQLMILFPDIEIDDASCTAHVFSFCTVRYVTLQINIDIMFDRFFTFTK